MADRSDHALTMLYFGGMWQILELWAKKVVAFSNVA